MVAAAQVDMVVLTVVPYAHLNVKVIRNNRVVDAQVLLVHLNVLLGAKAIHRNHVLTVHQIVPLIARRIVRMNVRVRPLKDVLIVQHNVAVIVVILVTMVVAVSVTHHVVVTVKGNVEVIAMWSVLPILKIRLVPHVVEHVGVHVTRTVHTIAIQHVRA